MCRLLVICHCLFVLEIRPPRNYLSFHVSTDISIVYAIMCISNVGVPVHVRVLCMGGNSLQSYLVLWDPMDYIPPGPSVHGILQAKIQEWVGVPYSRASSQLRDWAHITYVSCIGIWVLYQQHHLGSQSVY